MHYHQSTHEFEFSKDQEKKRENLATTSALDVFLLALKLNSSSCSGQAYVNTNLSIGIIKQHIVLATNLTPNVASKYYRWSTATDRARPIIEMTAVDTHLCDAKLSSSCRVWTHLCMSTRISLQDVV